MIALLLAATLAQAAVRDTTVRVLVLVQPETTTVGDPVVVTARIWAPVGAVVEFPAVVAAGDAVAALDPRVGAVHAGARETMTEATYRLVGWKIGTFALPLGDAVVTRGGAAMKVELRARSVVIRSVLPADTAKRVPRPARAMWEFVAPWWQALVPWLGAIAAALLAWIVWRRRQRHRRRDRTLAVRDPLADAEAAFDRLDGHGFAAGGEPGRHVALAAETVRDYLAARYTDAPTALTSTEVVALLRVRRGVPGDRLGALLQDADLVKFARRAFTPADATAFAAHARTLVREIHADSRPPVGERAA